MKTDMNISYKDAGVDIETGEKFIANIKSMTNATHNERVLNTLGSFASLYDMSGFEEPVLVSGTDGVGTKIMLAIKHNYFEGIGRDCVAMCLNDILCHGAQPLFFLDYLACGLLELNIATEIVRGISAACKDCNCALVGGETAEMPGMYQRGDYDVAGFTVGIVDRRRIIDGSRVQDGDILIGCASSGLHSNGYSLIRALFTDTDIDFHGKPLYHTLLTPTRIYVKSILQILDKFNFTRINQALSPNNMAIHGLAHITGGGLLENLPRTIPKGLTAIVDTKKIPTQKIFEKIRSTKQIEEQELWSTFNMGVGMVLVVQSVQAENILSELQEAGEQCFVMGKVSNVTNSKTVIAQKEGVCLI